MDLFPDPSGNVFHLSFRITDDFKREDSLGETKNSLLKYYLENIRFFLEKKNIEVVYSTGGIHLDASNPHIHYHLGVLMSKLPVNWNQCWKYFWKKNADQAIKPSSSIEYKPLGEKIKDTSKLHISIIGNPQGDDKSIEKFLAYPLKENLTLTSYCFNTDSSYVYLLSLGKSLYAVCLSNKERHDKKKEKTKSVYKKVKEFLQLQQKLGKAQNLYDCAELTIDHFRNYLPEEQQVQPSVLMNYVKKYCYYSGMWETHEILEKYL